MTKCKIWLCGLVVLLVAGLTIPAQPYAQQSKEEQGMELRALYDRLNSAIGDTLESVQQFNRERANKDEPGMQIAAANMLTGLTEARFWVTVLDIKVTDTEFDPKIDKDVADLRALITKAHQDAEEAVLTGDVTKIAAVMDKSANDYNTLRLSTSNVIAGLWPGSNPK